MSKLDNLPAFVNIRLSVSNWYFSRGFIRFSRNLSPNTKRNYEICI